MIPQPTYDAEQDFIIVQDPSYTYRLNYETTNRVTGFRDNLEAVKQAIYKLLNTERYQHVIYSWNYGIELQDLFGMPKSYVYPELKRRITEALLQDDRVMAVDGFVFGSKKNIVTAAFVVHTTFGEIETERTVNI